jgi:hypothetical protein
MPIRTDINFFIRLQARRHLAFLVRILQLGSRLNHDINVEYEDILLLVLYIKYVNDARSTPSLVAFDRPHDSVDPEKLGRTFAKRQSTPLSSHVSLSDAKLGEPCLSRLGAR